MRNACGLAAFALGVLCGVVRLSSSLASTPGFKLNTPKLRSRRSLTSQGIVRAKSAEFIAPSNSPSEPCGNCQWCLRRNLATSFLVAAGAAGLLGWKGGDQSWTKRFLVQQMRGMGDYERLLKPMKSALFQEAFRGLDAPRIVEVGVGLGVNFPFLREAGAEEVVAVDPNQYFTSSAADAARREGLQLTVQRGVMEALPFEAASVDVVVGTLVLCSVGDMAHAVSEAYRVLRPGGRYIFVEHTAAPPGSWVGLAQALFDPLQQAVAGGCHLTRDPLPLIEATFGPQQVFAERRQLAVGDGVGPLPPPHFLLSPHISGFAVKACAQA